MIDLDKLEALARAATPGPWEVQVDDRPHHRGGAHIERRIRTSWEHGQLKAPYPVITTSVGIGAVAGGPAHYMVSLGENDAAHIAATNPTAVLELIALARQADGAETVAIPLVSGEELLARTQPLPKWIDDMKGSGPTTDSLIEYIEQLRAAQPVQQPAPAAEPHYEAGRKQGRAEALAILMQLDPEGGIDKYTGWSTPVGPEDEGAAYWEEDKLRELFAADGALADMMDRAEAEYWKYLGMQDEAERAKNFAANMHNSGKVREVLSRAGEFDLMGHLCTTPPVQPFQQRVQPWMMACFGAEISADTKERNHRFFEESTELVQAGGMTASEAQQLVDYVYGRPVGDPAQEVGGVMVTLAALCLANGLDMHQAAEVELARIWTKVEAIRAKQAAKPKYSPLPAPSNAGAPIEAALAAFCDQEGYPSDGPMDGVLRKAFAAGASFAFDWKGGA